MKDVNFFVLLALALMGALVAMYACTARTSGSGIATATETNTATNAATNADDDWRSDAVLSATTGDLKVSGPYTHKNLEIYLVHGQDQAKPKREILTLEEALERKQAVVHETGNVGQLMVENLSPDASIHSATPPQLPAGLSPTQAAQLAELLEYLHLRMRGLIHSVSETGDEQQLTLNLLQWHNLIDLESQLAEIIRTIGKPS